MLRRTVTIGALVVFALTVGLVIGHSIDHGCRSPGSCFDQVAKAKCDSLEGRDNAALLQRSAVKPKESMPAGVNDWVFTTFCGDRVPDVRIEGAMITL